MRVVVKLTGLTPDTIRAWERRHGVIEAARTEGGARRYTDAHVRRLSLLRAVVARGHGIGDVASLDDVALTRLLGESDASLAPAHDPLGTFRREYLQAIARFEAPRGEELLARIARAVPPRALVLEGLAPVMHEIGEQWHGGGLDVSQEHLATQQIRALVEGQLQARALPPGAPRVVLAAPEHHRHDLGLVLAARLAVERQVEPVLLGADVPVGELDRAMQRLRGELLVLACTRELTGDEKRTLPPRLLALARRRETWVGVPPGHVLSSPTPPLRAFTSLEDFDHALLARFSR